MSYPMISAMMHSAHKLLAFAHHRPEPANTTPLQNPLADPVRGVRKPALLEVSYELWVQA